MYLLNRLLHKSLSFVPTIILIIVFSKVNMFIVEQITPENI